MCEFYIWFFLIFWTADKNTKVSMMINERPKSGWKRTWQNSGLTRNRTLACDDRLNSGGSRGETRGARVPPLFFHQNEARSAEKFFFETGPPPFLRVLMTGPPPYLKVWIRHCLTCPKDLVYIYTIFFEIYIEFLIQRLYIVCKTVSKHAVIYAPSLHHFDLSF